MGRLEGWRVTAALSGLVLAMACIIVAIEGMTEGGLRMLVRASARSSAVLFLTAFAAPGVAGLRWGVGGAWLGRNSSAIFLAFGFSHFVHLVALALWASLFPGSFFANLRLSTVIAGAVLYLFVGFLCIRALLEPLGRREWADAVDSVGRFLLWLAFTLAYLPRAFSGAGYGLLGLLAVASLVLRIAPRLAHARQASDVV